MTTVIVPTFNSEALVAGTLQSIREQSRQPENILVIDGGSRDGTLNVVAPFLRPCDRIVSEPDHGPCRVRTEPPPLGPFWHPGGVGKDYAG